MNLLTKVRIVKRILIWRLNWNKRDTHYHYTVDGNPRFMGPRDAVRLIDDGAVVAVSGLGGNQHATIMYWAIKEVFEESGHPRDLTLLAIGGQGGRGRVPGTIDELGVGGLTKCFITGHHETFKNMLRLGQEGKVELQCLPQGTLALLIDAQTRGEQSVSVPTGVGTAFDPETGRGTPLAPPGAEQWAAKEGDRIRYRIPPITVAIFNAPAADRQGNIYMKNTAMLAESKEIALAARRNGGKLIVVVGLIVEEGYDEIFLPSGQVDAIVQYPGTGQTLARPHRDPWLVLTTHSDVSVAEGYAQMRFINHLIGVTPRRTAVDEAIARLAAKIVTAEAPHGALVNIGTGLPEEVCRTIFEAGLLDDVTFFTESGVVGGLPGPGVFFGAAACPDSMVSSAEIFKRAHRELDVTILGILEVDEQGNVNVSKRGEAVTDYVGPGGFIDFSTSADMVLFVGQWMAKGEMHVEGARLRIGRRGNPKFVKHVQEITFSGPEALKAGRKVFYVTPVGVFRLTERGIELQAVMPGIDIQRDIVKFTPARIALPPSGEVPVIDAAVLTGDGYRIAMENVPAVAAVAQ